jgi:hypothetical protein
MYIYIYLYISIYIYIYKDISLSLYIYIYIYIEREREREREKEREEISSLFWYKLTKNDRLFGKWFDRAEIASEIFGTSSSHSDFLLMNKKNNADRLLKCEEQQSIYN